MIFLAEENWIERPYGRKKIISEDGKISHQLVLIDPGKNTGTGVTPDLVDKFGLVGHPGIFSEHIEHEGFLDRSESHEPSLKYVARGLKSEDPLTFFFAGGSAFYSVQTDEAKFGYWHVLSNESKKTIQLKLRVVKI
jgi:hypothetical protein